MTRNVIQSIIFLFALALMSAVAQAGDAPTLLPNGDFSTSAADGTPEGWPKASDNIDYPTEDGNRFLRLHATEPDKMILVYRAIPLSPDDKALELSCRVRYEDIQHGANEWFDGRIMMNFRDADKKLLKPSPAAPYFRKTHKDWMERTVSFLVPDGAKTLEFMPCLFRVKAGTIDFDDFKLRRLSDEETKALEAKKAEAEQKKAAAEAANDAKVDQKLKDRLDQTHNLISNGDFQTANKAGDWMADWGGKPQDGRISWEQEGGVHFVRLTTPEPDKLNMLYRMVLLPTDAGGLQITIRYRTDGVKKGKKMPGDARVVFHFLGGSRSGHLEDGPKMSPDPRAMVFSTKAHDWTEVTEQCIVPEGATKLQVMPGLWFASAGTLDLAEIKVAPLSDSDTKALADKIAAAKEQAAREAAVIAEDLARPAISVPLKVQGNQIVTLEGKPVWLQGLSVDSMQWGMGEHILWSIHTAIDDWHANVIRLAVRDDFWFGTGPYQNGNYESYRKLVDQAVQLCAAKGAYLVLDLHRFGAPREQHVAFWKDAAERYKNNPAVICELFNEPHGISWDVWRNGGNIKSGKVIAANVTENKEELAGDTSVGMQALVDAVRGTGAKNLIAAGGVDWSYDLTGIINGYALDDHGGDGIIYVSHIYPWKKNWQKNVLDTAAKYPVIITEVGAIDKWSDFTFITKAEQYPLEGWAQDVLGMIQKYKLNWTGFSFHPHAGPMIISDWNYTPTPYWGIYVKEALAGKQFESKSLR